MRVVRRLVERRQGVPHDKSIHPKMINHIRLPQTPRRLLAMMGDGRTVVLLLLLLWAPCVLWATEFFATNNVKTSQRSGSSSFVADVEFPVSGDAAAVRNVKGWICDQLDLEAEPEPLDEGAFRGLLRQSCEEFLVSVGGTSRRVEILRCYEDADVVTFSALVTDKDSATWRSEDYASFSKVDGHRIQVSEVFKCSEQQIKQLMWQWRADLPVGVSSADGLVVGDVAFLDGWIVVIGPAEGYTGAAYRIRYQSAEPYLLAKPGGRYFER